MLTMRTVAAGSHDPRLWRARRHFRGLGPVAAGGRNPGRAAIAPDHLRAEIGKLVGIQRRAGVMRRDTAMLGSEAESKGNVELRQRIHLPIEPIDRIGAETIGPGQPGPEVLYAEAAHPANGVIKAMVFEMKPLAQADDAGILRKGLECRLGRAILA